MLLPGLYALLHKNTERNEIYLREIRIEKLGFPISFPLVFFEKNHSMHDVSLFVLWVAIFLAERV